MNNEQSNPYYINDDTGIVLKLIEIKHKNDKIMATIYEMEILKEGKYKSLNPFNKAFYTDSAYVKLRPISYSEMLAIMM